MLANAINKFEQVKKNEMKYEPSEKVAFELP